MASTRQPSITSIKGTLKQSPNKLSLEQHQSVHKHCANMASTLVKVSFKLPHALLARTAVEMTEVPE